MNRTRAVASLASVLAVLAVTFNTAASAAPSPADVNAAAGHIFSGHYTAQDIAVVKSDPAVAALVPDPTAPLRVVAGSSSPQLSSAALTATAPSGCGYGRWVTEYQTSIIGTTIFGWRHQVSYCMGNSKITAWQSRYDYLSQADSGVYMRELVADSASGIGTWMAQSFRERSVEYCIVSWGCYSNSYPYSTIRLYGNGTWWYSGTAG